LCVFICPAKASASAQKLVHFAFGNAPTFAIKFALHRAKAFLAPDLGDNIHADILGIHPIGSGPIAQQPGVLIFLRHAGIGFQEFHCQPLEIVAFLALGFRHVAELVEKLAQRRGHLFPQGYRSPTPSPRINARQDFPKSSGRLRTAAVTSWHGFSLLQW